MPPKKKVKEPEPTDPEPTSSEPTGPEPQRCTLKIPKKPFYRSVKLDTGEIGKQIQIKLWKIDSLEDPGYNKNFLRKISRFSQKCRVLKNIRRYKYNNISFSLGPKVTVNQLALKSWRLEKLLFYSYWKVPISSITKSVRKSLNPHLKDFFVGTKCLYQGDFKTSIDWWKYLVNCTLWFDNSHILNTKSIRGFAKYLKGSNKNQVIEDVYRVVQDIPWKAEEVFDLSSMNANQLPNLQTFQVTYTASDEASLDFIKDYPQITSLLVSTCSKDAASFEFLSSLPNLKQLTLKSRPSEAPKVPKKLPLINSLEKFKITCYAGEFSTENLQEFLLKNKNLKQLEVDFSCQDNYIIFQENLVLPIEKLKLKLFFIENIYRIAVKKLAVFLANNHHLKSLEVDLGSKLSVEDCELLQKAVTSMACLEKLVWSWPQPYELQDIKLKEFKKIFTQAPDLQQLDLDFGSGVLMSRSCSSFIDGLLCLQKLKFLSLNVAFFKISPATLGKFIEFLRFMVLENAATVRLNLKGIPEEIEEEIKALLSKNTFSCLNKKQGYTIGPTW